MLPVVALAVRYATNSTLFVIRYPNLVVKSDTLVRILVQLMIVLAAERSHVDGLELATKAALRPSAAEGDLVRI